MSLEVKKRTTSPVEGHSMGARAGESPLGPEEAEEAMWVRSAQRRWGAEAWERGKGSAGPSRVGARAWSGWDPGTSMGVGATVRVMSTIQWERSPVSPESPESERVRCPGESG